MLSNRATASKARSCLSDPGANPEENRMIARTAQRGEFLAIEGARHLPHVDDAELFNRIVIDWCNKHTSTA